jgi:hypothetical protein
MLWALLIMIVASIIPVELRAQERYSVSYGGFAGYHAPLWAAKDLGLFAKHGLNADPVMISGFRTRHAGAAIRQHAFCSGRRHRSGQCSLPGRGCRSRCQRNE